MANNRNDTINELIGRHLAGECSAAEEKQLLSWINEHTENRKYFEDTKKAWSLADQHLALSASEEPNIDIDTEWDHFTRRAGALKPVKPRSIFRTWLRVAAAVLFLLTTGGILYYYTEQIPVTFETADARETIKLPDGSTVTLNRNSLLSYDRNFGGKDRTVTLNGEAFFEVTASRTKPFIVLTEGAKIQVVGTAFNVNAYSPLSTEVIVETGVVSLLAKGREPVKLNAGEKGIYSTTAKEVIRTINEDKNFRSWNTRRIEFHDSALGYVLETLRKTYHADIQVTVDIPASCVVTVTFDQQSLEAVMRVLERTLNLKYTVNGDNVVITEAGC